MSGEQQGNTPATPNTPAAPAVDEFAAAFAEAIADTPATPAAAADATPAAADDEILAGATPAAPVAEGAPDGGTPVAAAQPAAAAAAPGETPEAKIARLEAENATLRRPAAPAAPSAPAAAETPNAPQAGSDQGATPAEPNWYKPSEAETATLTKFREEWPDIAAAQELALKAASYNAVEYVFSQLAKMYNPILQRFGERADTIEQQLALSALRNEHDDYDDVRDKVVDWVETLPAAFRVGAKKAFEDGTPEEVAEVIAAYKQAHPPAGAPAAATPAPAAAIPAAPKAELSAAAKKAAGRLSVVGSQRSTPIAGADPNDFDGAWKEALGATG